MERGQHKNKKQHAVAINIHLGKEKNITFENNATTGMIGFVIILLISNEIVSVFLVTLLEWRARSVVLLIHTEKWE